MKNIKNILLAILVIVVIIFAGYMVAKYLQTVQINTNNINKNEVVNGVMNEIKNKSENVIEENEIKNESYNTIENSIINETEDNENEEQPIETNGAQTGEEDRQKAINMAKQDWGEDNNVSFKIDEQTEDGKFVVTVVDKNTTKVIFWYSVDVKNNTIEEK